MHEPLRALRAETDKSESTAPRQAHRTLMCISFTSRLVIQEGLPRSPHRALYARGSDGRRARLFRRAPIRSNAACYQVQQVDNDGEVSCGDSGASRSSLPVRRRNGFTDGWTLISNALSTIARTSSSKPCGSRLPNRRLPSFRATSN